MRGARPRLSIQLSSHDNAFCRCFAESVSWQTPRGLLATLAARCTETKTKNFFGTAAPFSRRRRRSVTCSHVPATAMRVPANAAFGAKLTSASFVKRRLSSAPSEKLGGVALTVKLWPHRQACVWRNLVSKTSIKDWELCSLSETDGPWQREGAQLRTSSFINPFALGLVDGWLSTSMGEIFGAF